VATGLKVVPFGYEVAWNALYGTWLPENGYQLGDRPSFEIYLNNPEE
jgi:DNA gyrase inhibitor GyrI